MSRASCWVSALEWGEGMTTQVSRSGPTASAASIATRAESIPPERARPTCLKPFLPT